MILSTGRSAPGGGCLVQGVPGPGGCLLLGGAWSQGGVPGPAGGGGRLVGHPGK